MRAMLRMAMAAFLAAGCYDDVVYVDDAPPAPTGLFYQLEPTGDPLSPRGVLLRWDASADPNVAIYRVYSRSSTASAFGLRGSTTSPSFHDDGQPHVEYYVTAESDGGGESDPSASVVIDERLRLQAPASLTSVSLDGRIHLGWSDNAYQNDPNGFSHYRIYATSYDLDNNLCGTSWTLDGTTVAPAFLDGALTNGVPRCFGVSAVSIEGFESLWSPLRYDTPRPEARNLIIFTTNVDPARNGFRFFFDANGDGRAGPLELGIVGAGGSMDFTLSRDAGNNLILVPQRTATELRLYSSQTIADLTTIDIAPATGFGRAPLTAVPQLGYVFQMNEGDGFYRYGAIRVTAVGADYVIFDWSYQTDPGNPELIRVRG